MSRIGLNPIIVPEGVEYNFSDQLFSAKSQRGDLSIKIDKGFNIVKNDKSLPKKRSRCLTRNWVNKTKIRINKERKNGDINSLNIYRFNIFTYKYLCIDIIQ